MTKSVEKDVDKLKADLSKFRDDLENTLSDLGGLSHDKLIQTRENLRKAKDAFEGMAHQKYDHARDYLHDKGEHAVDTSRQIVQDKPFMTVAVSFGAGLLAAMLLERSRK